MFTFVNRATTTIHPSSVISIHIIVVSQTDFPSPSAKKYSITEPTTKELIVARWRDLNLEDWMDFLLKMVTDFEQER